MRIPSSSETLDSLIHGLLQLPHLKDHCQAKVQSVDEPG